MMTLQMDKNTASSPRERAKSIFDKVLPLFTSLNLGVFNMPLRGFISSSLLGCIGRVVSLLEPMSFVSFGSSAQ